MLFRSIEIEPDDMVANLVEQDYRTAAVFRKYGIEYCCAGRKSLHHACMMAGIDFELLKEELESASRIFPVVQHLPFDQWSVEFLTAYIKNVHHYFLKTSLPETEAVVKHFAGNHKKKYPNMSEVADLVLRLRQELIMQMEQEELVLFPYMIQVEQAFLNKDSYGSLLVKRLGKPLADISERNFETLLNLVTRIRKLAGNYDSPEGTCISYRLSMRLLNAMDTDLSLHGHIENAVLVPAVTKMEKILLQGYSYYKDE